MTILATALGLIAIVLWILYPAHRPSDTPQPQSIEERNGSSLQAVGDDPASDIRTTHSTGDRQANVEVTDVGELDAEGFSTSPLLAMNSTKLDQSLQRQPLRSDPPQWLAIGEPILSRFAPGPRDAAIEWRERGSYSWIPVNKSQLAGMLSVDEESIPQGIGGVLLKSPSGNRLLTVACSDCDVAALLTKHEGKLDMKSRKPIPRINYDDNRRWFIRWEAFLTESLIVGTMAEPDADTEVGVRYRLYTYDIDKSLLRRVILPKEIQKNENSDWVIEAVASSAITLRVGMAPEPVTLYIPETE